MTEYVPWIIEGGFAIGILAFMWKINADSNRKVNRVFGRLDEHKDVVSSKMAKDYVSKEMCHLMHNNGLRDFERLENKVDAGFNKLDKKIDVLMSANGHN